ncbi:MAG: hypothetical protein R2744_07000 [Bacteroidales bacterium]
MDKAGIVIKGMSMTKISSQPEQARRRRVVVIASGHSVLRS